MKRNVYLALIAFVSIVVFMPAMSARAGMGQWTTSGPYGGVVSVVAVSPGYWSDRTAFVGVSGGRVYKTTDRGTNWSASSSGLVGSDAVISLAISPNFVADQTLFAGINTGGLFKSVNGGTTWTAVTNGVQAFSDVRAIVFSPSFIWDKTVFVGSFYGLHKSTDAGATWTAVSTGMSGSSTYIFSLAISPNFEYDGTVFAGSYLGDLYKTTNGGTNWSTLVTGTSSGQAVNSLAISPNYPSDLIVYAGKGDGLFKTANGGSVWTKIDPAGYGTVVNALAITPTYTTDKILYVSIGIATYRLDHDLTWTAISTGLSAPPIRSFALSPAYVNDATIFAGGYGGAYKSTWYGMPWVEINRGIINADVFSVAMPSSFPGNPTVFAGSRGSGVLKSTDGGVNWTASNSGIPDLIYGRQIYSLAVSPGYDSDSTVFASTYASGVFKSTDGGVNWAAVNNGIGTTGVDLIVTALVMSPNFTSDQTLFAGLSSRKKLFITTDGGANWTLVLTTPGSLLSLAISPNYASDRTVFVGTSQYGVYKTTDGGATWVAVNSGITDLSINSLALSPDYVTDQTVFAGSQQKGIFRSTNGGLTWSNVYTTTNGPTIRSLAVSPDYANDRTVVAGTGTGLAGGYSDGLNAVLKSANGGQTWTKMNAGLPANLLNVRPTIAFSPSYQDDHTLFAGTQGYGVYSFTKHAPVAANDSYSVMEDAVLTVAAPAVLANDSDALGHSLTAILVSGPTRGTANLNSNGSFTYTPEADYTGFDSFNYKANDGLADSNIATVTITVVAKITPVITWGNPADIVYGTALSDTQLNATSSVPGTFIYTPPAGTVLNAGSGQTLTATFTPSDTTNYNGASASVAINVLKATPVITWANPADIVYGTALGDTQLNATGSVPGDFAYAPSAGTVLNAGPGQTLSVTFNPSDAANYTAATGSVLINVLKKDQTISFGPLEDKTYGDPDFTVSATADSGLPVTYSAMGNCTVSGNTVHLTGVGNCTVTAQQPGVANYNAAPDVPRSFTILAAAPDLVETSITNPPASIKRNGKFSVTDVTGNIGKATSGKNSTTRYYLSKERAKNAGSKLLTGTRTVSALAPGATSTGTKVVTVPSSTTAGTYYLLACADDTNAVSESNEANNCLASTSTVIVK